MATSGVRQMLTLILTFVSRTVFIEVLGARYLGINGLFSNILELLALSELGIGVAISYYLYKPLAIKDTERIKTLMRFYKQCYRYVGLAIIILGSAIMPFLNRLVNLNQPIPENIYLIYFLFLLNSAFTYLFWAYKQALMTANQKQYKIEKINIVFSFISCLTDIVILLIFRDFIVYLLSKMAVTILKNVVIAKKIDREYPFLKDKDVTPLTKHEIKNIFKGVFNISIFKLGSVLFNSTTNIIISIFLGTIIVGYYSNYYMIINQVNIIFGMIISSITAGIGNVIATESKKKIFSTYKMLDMGVFIINCIFTICLFQLFNSFVNVWLGKVDHHYVLEQVVVGIICIDFYLNNSCQVINSFRTAAGHFKEGRNLQCVAGVINVFLSIWLTKKVGLAGSLLSPVLCKLFITVCPFMVILGRNLFNKGFKSMMGDFFKKLIMVVVNGAVVWLLCLKFHERSIGYFVVEIIITVFTSCLLLFVMIYRETEFKQLVKKCNIKNFIK
jgi:O-antigen/teichoic acid export membrane protein